MSLTNLPYTLHLGDCLETLRTLPDSSVDAVVTDPPYGLSFMGKRWDYDVPSTEIWAECLRVLKPGGHLLAFAGTRTQHRMAVRIEDAGFEIRDMIAWVYGSGFPKSLDVSKAIDKAAGADRPVVGVTRKSVASMGPGQGNFSDDNFEWKTEFERTGPSTDAAHQWDGWGTALKPALEPITVARKPLTGTVAANVLAHGTGALNIDGCRVGSEERSYAPKGTSTNAAMIRVPEHRAGKAGSEVTVNGRWPANLIHDGSDEVVALFPAETGQSAARFFYCAKTSRKDRNEGLQDPGPQLQRGTTLRKVENADLKGNTHPTVKPTDLMAYLCRLVTPPGGIVLDPFMGSGSTGKAAMREGFQFIGCELDAAYLAIAQARIEHEHGKRVVVQDLAAAAEPTQVDMFGAAC